MITKKVLLFTFMLAAGLSFNVSAKQCEAQNEPNKPVTSTQIKKFDRR